jgi:hypothetical protein
MNAAIFNHPENALAAPRAILSHLDPLLGRKASIQGAWRVFKTVSRLLIEKLEVKNG